MEDLNKFKMSLVEGFEDDNDQKDHKDGEEKYLC